MKTNSLLDALFPKGHSVQQTLHILIGSAITELGEVTVMGTSNGAAIDHSMALDLAGCILHTIINHPGRPIVMIVDTCGQNLSRRDELLCLNGTLAHLAECVELARIKGHPTISIVNEQAVSGGFLSYGLMADRVFAFSDSQVRVMDLKAMARVTKVPHDSLVELAQSSPIFAPGPENYERMGAIDSIWPQPSDSLLLSALRELCHNASTADLRAKKGFERGGRLLAATTAAAFQV